MKPILLSLFLLVFNTKGNAQNIDSYLDSIHRLLLDNRLVALDSNENPIPYQTIVDKYQSSDTVINDLWTRPKFINNLYHASFDGIHSTIGHPDFDTSFYKSKPKYISFIENICDDNGNYCHKKWAFMINRNAASLPLKLLHKQIRKGIKPKKSCSQIAKIIQTNKNEVWINERFEIDGFPYPIDSCMSIYSLRLSHNYEFEHQYAKDSFCVSPSCFHEKTIGTEGSIDNFLNYSERVQYYKIENPSGYWTVEVSDLKDTFLVFYSKNGYRLASYKLQIISKNSLVLYFENQKISLQKVIQKR